MADREAAAGEAVKKSEREKLSELNELVRDVEAFTKKLLYKPARTYDAGKGPPKKLGLGMVAINVPDRRMWIGTYDGTVEVKEVGELIDHWVRIIEDG